MSVAKEVEEKAVKVSDVPLPMTDAER